MVAVDQRNYAAVVSWLPEEANYWADFQNFKVWIIYTPKQLSAGPGFNNTLSAAQGVISSSLTA